MKKILSFMALVFAVLILNVGCSSNSGTTIRVTQYLSDPVLVKIMNNVVADIDKRHPGLHVKLEIIPYTEYQQKIMTEMSADNAPDVINVEVNNFVDLYLRNALEDLTPYIQKEKLDMSGYYPGVLNRFSPNGKCYSIPADTAPTGLVYYNKKFFKEAGLAFPTPKWKWPEPFLSICKKLTKKDAAGHTQHWAYSEAYPIQFEDFMYGAGGSWVDNPDHPTRFTMDTPQVLKAAQFRWDLVYKYHVSPSPAEIQSFAFGAGAEDMFMQGKLAMMASGIWHTPRFLQDKDLDFDVVPFPAGPAGKKGWGTGGSGYSLCKGSKHKDLAWIVLKEITSEATLAMQTATGSMQPAIIKLANSDVFLKSPGAAHKGYLLDMPQYSHYQPFMSNWGEVIWGEYVPGMDPVWLGTKKPGDVLPALTKKINEKYFSNKK